MTPAIFHSLYLKYSKQLFFYAVKMIDNVLEAEDIVQEVFVSLWQQNKNNHEIHKSYLYSSVKNLCVNYLKHSVVVKKSDKELSYLSGHEEDYISAKIIKSEVLMQVYQEVESLPAECRKIFKMIFIEGLGYSEIAHALGVTESTVRNQKERALKLLKIKIFKEQGFIF